MRGAFRQAGFTLIEVMIVTAIIGILAVIAIRSMNAYAARAKVAEAMLALTSCRTLISEVYLTADVLPAANGWGCESTGATKFVGSVATTAEGIVKVELRGMGDLRLDFHTITMAPLDPAGNLMSDFGRVAIWRCGATVDGTDLNVEFLPATCRGN
jgi:type IV pilus assembly protein PilA